MQAVDMFIMGAWLCENEHHARFEDLT